MRCVKTTGHAIVTEKMAGSGSVFVRTVGLADIVNVSIDVGYFNRIYWLDIVMVICCTLMHIDTLVGCITNGSWYQLHGLALTEGFKCQYDEIHSFNFYT
jgi:hypothetical protein